MVKLLLIRPNERLHLPARETNATGLYPPLGLASIAAVLRAAGHRLSVVDAHALGLSDAALADAVRRAPAEIALFSSTTLVWPAVAAAAAIVRETLPSALIVVGGPQLSVYPEESLSFPWIDAGVRGEGEKAVLELVSRFEEGTELGGIRGLVTRREGKVVANGAAEPVEDLDSLPFPAVDLFPWRRYRALNVDRPFFTMVSARGCPFHCAFCSQDHAAGPRLRGPENVVEEMERYVKDFGAREIVFFDETFTYSKPRVLAICDELRRRRLSVRWNIRTRVDTVDREILEALRSAGCSSLHMGVESGSQEILDAMRKGITLEQVRAAFSSARALGFETRGYFMIGYPGETRESFEQTLAFARALPLDWASFTVTVPHPGTELHRRALSDGVMSVDYWREYTLGRAQGPVPYFTSTAFNRAELEACLRRAYASFYLRPQVVGRKLFSKNALRLVRSAAGMLRGGGA